MAVLRRFAPAAMARPVRTARRARARVLSGRLGASLAAATAAGRHADAVALIERELPRHVRDRAFLREASASAARAGALELQVSLARATAQRSPSGRTARRLRRLEGQLRETSEEWAPAVPGPPAPVRPVDDGRVLHLLKASLPYRQSGYTLRTLHLLVAEQRGGREPVAMTALDFPRRLGHVGAVPAEEDVAGVRHVRLDRPVVPPGQPVDDYLDDWAAAAAPHVRRLRPAVLHVHSGHRGYESALVGLALGRHADLPVVYEVRGFFEYLWAGPDAWVEQAELTRRRRDTDTRAMLAADAVVTLNETMRAAIVGRGVPADRVHVVPNGIDVEAFAPRARREDLVARYGLKDRLVVGYVSNLDHPREGQELLVRAAVELRRRGVPATALLVGDGQRRGRLERLARRLRAGDAVVLTGSVPHDEVADYYALLDVFVVPRLDEPASRLVTPLKPYEAMAAGRPLLVSGLPALQELVADGRGREFEPGNVSDLVDRLAELAADPELRGRLADRARTWVCTERTWARSAQRYGDVYDAVLQRRRSEPARFPS